MIVKELWEDVTALKKFSPGLEDDERFFTEGFIAGLEYGLERLANEESKKLDGTPVQISPTVAMATLCMVLDALWQMRNFEREATPDMLKEMICDARNLVTTRRRVN